MVFASERKREQFAGSFQGIWHFSLKSRIIFPATFHFIVDANSTFLKKLEYESSISLFYSTPIASPNDLQGYVLTHSFVVRTFFLLFFVRTTDRGEEECCP